MSWFQNPFFEEYLGNWVLGDRQHSLTFKCPRNAGRGESIVVSWNLPAYDFTGNDADGNPALSLRIRTAFNTNIRQWAEMNVTGTAPTLLLNATTADEVVAALNSDVTFAPMFTASIQSETGEGGIAPPAGNRRVMIRSNFDPTRMKFYIVNGRAEEVLGFNARAGVAELPTYFSRHGVNEWDDFDDSTGMMVPLDTIANAVDAAVVNDAVNFRGVALNFTAATVQDDYELLEGRSGIFNFQSITLLNTDGAITGTAIERIAEIIEYPAGAVVGDLGRKITYAYTGIADNNLQPTQTTEEPYTLEAGDLVTP
mgnify:CR=1 FL=1|jgi:hypothetical protein